MATSHVVHKPLGGDDNVSKSDEEGVGKELVSTDERQSLEKRFRSGYI
jgi:hypothetical protein